MRSRGHHAIVVVLMLFGWAPVSTAAAAVANPSFEDNLNGWTEGGSNFGQDVLDNGTGTGSGGSLSVNGFPTDGDLYARIFSGSNTDFVTGEFGSIGQTVDLTGIARIVFDASLERFASDGETNGWDSNFEAGFFIDGVAYWTTSTFSATGYLDQAVDTSGLSGSHTIEFRNTRTGPDGFAEGSNWFLFDNVRTDASEGDGTGIPEPGPLALVAFGLVALTWHRRRASRDRTGYSGRTPVARYPDRG